MALGAGRLGSRKERQNSTSDHPSRMGVAPLHCPLGLGIPQVDRASMGVGDVE